MNKLLRNDLIILDELGYIQLDATGSDHLFQLVARAYERRSLIVTSNLIFRTGDNYLTSRQPAAAFLDRLLHPCPCDLTQRSIVTEYAIALYHR